MLELLQGQVHALAKLLRGSRGLRGERAFEIVNHRKQFANEGFLLPGGAAIRLLGGPFAEVVEVGGEVEMEVFLARQLSFQRMA